MLEPRELIWLLSFVLLVGFESIKELNPTLYILWCAASLLPGIFVTCIFIKIGEIKKPMVYAGIFLMIPVVTSIINKTGNYLGGVYQFYCCFIMILAVECVIKRMGIQRALHIFTVLFEILIYANFVCMLIFPNGLLLTMNNRSIEWYVVLSRDYIKTDDVRVWWLLGHQGLLTIYSIVGTCCSLLYSSLQDKGGKVRVRTLIFMLITSIEVYVFTRSGNTLITYTLFLALYFILHGRKRIKLPSLKLVMISLIIMFFLCVYTDFLNTFSVLIVKILNRDLTLTGRITAWRRVILAITQRPLLGYGYLDSKILWKIFITGTHPHNQFLFITFQGGLLALFFFIRYLLITIKPLLNQKNEIIMILWISVCTLLTGMMGDRYIPYYNVVFILFELCFYALEITKEYRELERGR